MAKYWIAALLMVALGVADAPAQERIVVPYRHSPVTVDGFLREWPAEPSLRLDRQEQIWSEQEWGGVADLSAEFYIAYDTAHLYLAGRVRDDSFRAGRVGVAWHRQDAIELFLAMSPDLASGEPRFSAGDLQFFIMPFSKERPWGVMTGRGDGSGPMPTRPGGEVYTGVRVAHQVESEGSYSFEVVIPFHNFPGLVPGTSEIGFNLALDDYDAGTERYQYMSWNGQTPATGGRLGLLHFDGPAPLSEAGVSDTGLLSWLAEDGPFILLPLLGLLISVLLILVWARLGRRLPALKPIGWGLGVLLFGLGLILPNWAGSWRQEDHSAESDRVVRVLSEALDQMAFSALGSYRGATRDQPLMDLLAGKTIASDQKFSHRLLDDMVESGAGSGLLRPSALGGFQIRPYWVPIRQRQAERFNFPEPLAVGRINLVLARLQSEGLGFEPAEADATMLQVTLRNSEEGPESAGKSIEFRGPFYPISEFEQDRMEATFQSIEVREGLRSIGLMAMTEGELYLVGMTWVSRDGSSERALYLGEDSLGGVVTGLRGPLPEQAGFVLAPGARRRFVVAEDQRDQFEKLWLFYNGDHSGRTIPDLDRGDRVCELRLEFETDGLQPQVLDFQHQLSMFFQQTRNNQSLTSGGDVAIAYQWQDAEQESQVTLVREIDLPANTRVRALDFHNTGPYPIRFRATVFGREQMKVATSMADGPIQRRGRPGQEGLRPELLEQLGAASFAVYRQGRLSAASLPVIDGSDLATISTATERALAAGQVASQRRQTGADGLRYERYFALTGEGWSGEVLGVFIQDRDHGSAQRLLEAIGLMLCLAAAPVLLLLFSEALAFVHNLRLRLVAVLSMATLAPLGILSYVLLTVLESGHEDELRGGLEQGMASVQTRLKERKAQQQQAADSWLRDLVATFAEQQQAGDPGADAEPALRAAMRSQLPPEWREQGGYLSFEYVPATGASNLPGSFSIFVGAEDMRYLGSSLREEPSLALSWGVPVLGAQSVASLPAGGECYLTVGRRMDPTFLAELAPGRTLILCDAHGYPLSVTEGDLLADREVFASSKEPAECADRRAAWDSVLERGGPQLARHHHGQQDLIAIYDLLRDAQETPRLLLGLVAGDSPAVLPLRVGPVPVRNFFATAAGLLLMLSVFLGFVVTSRISRPIEQLEKGARALSRGQLGVRVDTDERGQLGSLTRSFNQMSEDLHGRIEDLRSLNQGIQELTSKLQLDEVLAVAREFFIEHSDAERVLILLSDPQAERLQLHGADCEELDRQDDLAKTLLSASGPFSMRVQVNSGPLAGHGSLLGLPLLLAGRSHGVVLLLYASKTPGRLNLDLTWAMATQASAVIENARLYRYAVEDRSSGALLPDYFHHRLAGEVSAAQVSGRELCLLGLRLSVAGQMVRVPGGDGHAGCLEVVVRDLREHLDGAALICRIGDEDLQVLLVGVGAEQGERILAICQERLSAIELKDQVRLRVDGALAVYPKDGASAEFLLETLAARLTGGRAPGLPVHLRLQAYADEGVFQESPAMDGLLRSIERLAPTDITLLLEGETGTGKEVLTNLIHRMSKRASGPLVKVHCAALSESLLQSELFGHEKGAFTGAIERKIGRFELADGGTIFLDEIGEVSLEVQVKLLRVLQEREIERVGGVESIPVDVRVIAATNRDIHEMVAEGSFREDLYYRLQGMVLRVPPLRERRGEIPGLVAKFHRDAVAAGQTQAKGFSTDALDQLFRGPWPGNIRELRNAVFRALVFAQGDLVTTADLDGLTETLVDAGQERRELGQSAPEPAYVLPSTPPRAAAELPPRLRLLFNLVRERGSVSTHECSQITGVSQRTALRDLTSLQSAGLLLRKGKRRGARYEIAPEQG